MGVDLLRIGSLVSGPMVVAGSKGSPMSAPIIGIAPQARRGARSLFPPESSQRAANRERAKFKVTESGNIEPDMKVSFPRIEFLTRI
jgi:hypothetical protein